MIKFFDRFKDWKKNIKYAQIFDANVVFDDSSLFDTLKRDLPKFNTIADELGISTGLYRKKFIKEGYHIDEDNKSQQLYLESKDLIEGTYFHGALQFSSYVNVDRGIDSTTIRCTSKTYPEVLLQYVLSEYHSSINNITLTNPLLKSWDNRTSPNSYKYKKGVSICFDAVSGSKQVDVSNRPGRSGVIGTCFFRGANEYWFGKSYFDCVGKDKILAFKNADSIKELENDIVHIKLFDEEKYWEDDAQNKLAAFRSYLNVKDINNNPVVSKANKFKQSQPTSSANKDPKFPINFGRKSLWMAVKTQSHEQLFKVLKIKEYRESDWQEGMKESLRGDLFISPSIDDWILVKGWDLPTPDSESGISSTEKLLNQLSQKFGEAQLFGSYNVNSLALWMRSVDGVLIRSYFIVDGASYIKGAPTEIEKQWDLLDLESTEAKLDSKYWSRKLYPDINHVLEVAQDWSVNPMELEGRNDIGELGYIAKYVGL